MVIKGFADGFLAWLTWLPVRLTVGALTAAILVVFGYINFKALRMPAMLDKPFGWFVTLPIRALVAIPLFLAIVVAGRINLPA